MKLLVTGSRGFLGRHTVETAIDRGHEVRALVRPATLRTTSQPVQPDDRVDVVSSDLRTGPLPPELLDGIDVVVHLAGVKVGDLSTQFDGTVRSTENLLDGMLTSGVRRLVGVSTLAVYDFLRMRPGHLLTEASPIETNPRRRGAYAQTKLVQERLMTSFGDSPGHHVAVTRPGMVYGPQQLWHPLLGIDIGSGHVCVGPRRILPMVYVEHCADALVRAAEILVERPDRLDGRPLNLLDDDLPTCRDYAREVAATEHDGRELPVPWTMLRTVVAAVEMVDRRVFDGRAILPDVATRPELHARFKPLRYSNQRARETLGWEPRVGWREAVSRSATPSIAGGRARTL